MRQTTKYNRFAAFSAMVLMASMMGMDCQGTSPMNPGPGMDPVNNPDPGTDPDPGTTPDPGTDPGSGTDPGPDPTPDANAGFTLVTPIHVGSEAIIAGPQANPANSFIPPEKFNIGRLTLSGDGRFIYFYLYWDSVSTAPADWIRLYRIDIDGLAWERFLINEEAAAFGGGYLTSNRDGTMGVYEMQRCEPGGVFCRAESRFLKLISGQAATPFYDTEDDAGLPSSAGPRLTDDGQTIYWHEIERFWRASTTNGGAVELASVAHLNFYGPWDPFTGGQITSFDITGTGASWLLGLRFVDPQTSQLRWELIKSGGALPQNLAGLPKQTNLGLQPVVQISDDGEYVGYEEANGFGTGGAYVQSSTYAADMRAAASPSTNGAYGLVLADNGQRALLEVNMNNQRTPVFHDIASGTRRRAGSTRYSGTAGGVYARFLSDDGRTCAGFWNARAIGTPLNNIHVLRDGVDNLPGYPKIGEMRYKYDSATDKLIIRVHVTSAAGLERIYLLPHHRGIEPVGSVADAENPLYNERWGGGVNLSTLFTPVDGQPNVYERSIAMNGKHGHLSGLFSVRIVAVDSTGTRTTFRDMAVSP